MAGDASPTAASHTSDEVVTTGRLVAVEVGHRVERVLRVLSGVGLRVTRARRGVVEVLAATDEYVVVDEVVGALHDRGSSVDRSTVHRALAELVGHGLAHRFVVAGDAGQGRWAYGLTSPRSYYALCTTCRRTVALSPDLVDDVVQVLELSGGFTVAPGVIGFQGLCQQCRGDACSSAP